MIEGQTLPASSAHERSTKTALTLPGDEGFWFFIIADMCAFALFFLLFTAGRIAEPELYEQSRQQLNPAIGLLNTLILLTSGMFMARAVRYARAGDRRNTLYSLILTLTIGLGFGITKIIEYNIKLNAGISLLTNEFFTYYFAFTGIHFLHFIIGIGVLGFAIAKTRSDEMDSAYVRWIEAGGCYWHMVDLLWVMLFPMIYLMRAS